MQNQAKWDQDYLDLAMYWARKKSKDPSTQVGAVVVDAWNNVAALCWNGFPKGVLDTPERYADREEKYPRIVHADLNAVIAAGHDCRGGTLYAVGSRRIAICNECAKAAIQAGIRRVVGHAPGDTNEKWDVAGRLAVEMFQEAGVTVVHV